MIRHVAPFILLLACTEGTGPGQRPAIVYMSMGSLAGGYGPDADVFVMDSVGRHVVNITHRVGRDEDPAWSPNESKIIFSSRGHDSADGSCSFLSGMRTWRSTS